MKQFDITLEVQQSYQAFWRTADQITRAIQLVLLQFKDYTPLKEGIFVNIYLSRACAVKTLYFDQYFDAADYTVPQCVLEDLKEVVDILATKKCALSFYNFV